MKLMVALCDVFPNERIDGGMISQFKSYTDPVLAVLAEKLGDNILKIRNSSEEAFMCCAGNG
jgi:hypothetical protein